MGMGQELNKQWEWEWESIRMGMGMTPIPMGMDSHQRLMKIVVEYSNKWLIQYLLLEADRISFLFSFSARKMTIFLFFGVLFFGRKSLYFRTYFIFRPKNPRKPP